MHIYKKNKRRLTREVEPRCLDYTTVPVDLNEQIQTYSKHGTIFQILCVENVYYKTKIFKQDRKVKVLKYKITGLLDSKVID